MCTCSCVQEPCLLPEVTAQDQGKICVVIDLDETLVHSSFKVIAIMICMVTTVCLYLCSF